MAITKTAPITTSDVGLAIPIDLCEDVSGYTNYSLLLKSPADGTVKEEVCQIDPNDNNNILLTLQATTFDSPGTWIAQPKLILGAETIYGDEFEIQVVDILS